MRTLLALSAFTGLAALAAPAMAQQQPGEYLQVSAGAGVGGTVHLSVDDSVLGQARHGEQTKTGPFVSVAAGRSLPNGFAVEVEALYLENKIETEDINGFLGFPLDAQAKTYAVMVNGLYAIGKTGPVVPYVGAGVGWGKSTYKAVGETQSDNGLVWQARAGLALPMSDKVTWDFGYRYLEAPEFKKTYGFDDGSGGQEFLAVQAKTKQHILSAGVRWRY
ncbi:MAG TPA: outer membrane beta-barrel protein [Caulobacteraceae bacterium]|nr:outer membrane beta-barrel protein [Caulobacteraceae bacterium]